MDDQPPPADPDFVVIDVETACARTSSICQVGVVGFRDGREIFAWETLLDPCDAFDPFNTRIHGIAAHHVAGQPTFAHVHATIDRHLSGRTTVAHSGFDKGALAAACRLHVRPPIETRWLDSVRVARRAWPDLANHRLGTLARYLGIVHRHHDALSDARAAGWIVVKAIDQTGLSLTDLTAPPRSPAPAPRAAAEGPLRGERVAIAGEPRDGPLAHEIAAAGGAVLSVVGLSTTLLVAAADEPFPTSIRASNAFRRAQKAIADGRPIRILSARRLRQAISPGRPASERTALPSPRVMGSAARPATARTGRRRRRRSAGGRRSSVGASSSRSSSSTPGAATTRTRSTRLIFLGGGAPVSGAARAVAATGRAGRRGDRRPAPP